MSTEGHQIVVGGVQVEVVRKRIKNLHLAVYPPHGRVRVAAPLAVDDAAVRLAVVLRMGWIKRQQAQFDGQARETERRYVSGETHFFQGRRLRLQVIEGAAAWQVVPHGKRLEFHVRSQDTGTRERAFHAWQRRELKQLATPLVARWSAALGVIEPAWGIKRMRTRWGTCSPEARRIWLNLELIKKPPACLDYIVVHELMHLLEPSHSAKFVALMDHAMPGWPAIRAELNAEMLTHEDWDACPSNTAWPRNWPVPAEPV